MRNHSGVESTVDDILTGVGFHLGGNAVNRVQGYRRRLHTHEVKV